MGGDQDGMNGLLKTRQELQFLEHIQFKILIIFIYHLFLIKEQILIKK